MHGEGDGPSANARSIFVVVEEVDGIIFDGSALMVESDNHADIFVPGHALHLMISEAQA